MSLTPLDVKKQEFDKVFRGYDPVAVDAFLELAAEEMGSLVTRVHALEEKLRGLDETLDDYRKMERALKETMLSAQRLVEEAKQAAQRDAELIRREARLEAEGIVSEASRRRAALEQRVTELEQRERAFIGKMKGLLEDHRRALEAHETTPVVSREGDPFAPGGAWAEEPEEIEDTHAASRPTATEHRLERGTERPDDEDGRSEESDADEEDLEAESGAA